MTQTAQLREQQPTQSVLMDSPIGVLRLVSDGEALVGLFLPPHDGVDLEAAGSPAPVGDILLQARTELEEYFAGARQRFEVPVRPHGTPFQQRVWSALLHIPYGHTTSYGRLAAELGDPRASRAVGLANGRNPLSLFVPCHRVVGANGKLVGYGGGMERKRWLLDHEAQHASSRLF